MAWQTAIPLMVAGAQAVGTWWSTRRQEKFANQQTSTQYQRAVRDLQMAGLNPMMAYGQGGAGSMGINPQNPFRDAASAVTLRALQKQTTADVGMKNAHRDVYNQMKNDINAARWIKEIQFQKDAAKLPLEVDYLKASITEIMSRVGVNSAHAANIRAQFPGLKWQAGKYKEGERFGDLFPKGMNFLKYIPGMMMSPFSAARQFFSRQYINR